MAVFSDCLASLFSSISLGKNSCSKQDWISYFPLEKWFSNLTAFETSGELLNILKIGILPLWNLHSSREDRWCIVKNNIIWFWVLVSCRKKNKREGERQSYWEMLRNVSLRRQHWAEAQWSEQVLQAREEGAFPRGDSGCSCSGKEGAQPTPWTWEMEPRDQDTGRGNDIRVVARHPFLQGSHGSGEGSGFGVTLRVTESH